MGLTKYESAVKTIPHACAVVYSRLSDLNNLSKVREYVSNPDTRERFASQIPVDKARQFEDILNSMTFDYDSVTFSVPVAGKVVLHVVERDEPKLIKFEAKGAPVAANVWIQLLPAGDDASRLKVTLGASLNFFIKGMADKYAPAAVERIADVLASLPYDKI